MAFAMLASDELLKQEIKLASKLSEKEDFAKGYDNIDLKVLSLSHLKF